MWLIKGWRFIMSYLKIKVEGTYTEKFVNLAVIRGVGFWNLKKNRTEATLELPVKNLKRLRPIARQTGCRIKILEKQGLLVWWKKGRKSKGFVLGALFFLASLYVATSFVWFVQAAGNKELTEEEVVELAAEAGLQPGMYKGHLEVDKIEARIARMHEDIVWAGLRIRGTTVEVEIVEHKKVKEEVPPRGVKADLVASRDGYIVEVLELEGEAEVEPGDTVSPGDILIRGERTTKIHDDPEEAPEKERVFPRGKVEARVWYDFRAPVQEREKLREFTGRKESAYYIAWKGERRLLRGPEESPFSNYQKEVNRGDWELGGREIPLDIITVQYREVETETRRLSREEAEEKAKRKARRKASRELSEETEVRDYRWERIKEDGKSYIMFVIETIEDIAEIRYYSDNN